MVMKRNSMRRNLRNSILRSLGRYIAIAAIIALGAALFIGLLMTKADMVATGQEFMVEKNMFDIRLVSTYGWGKDQPEQAAQWDGVEAAEGVFYTDLISSFGEQEDAVYRFYTIPENMNRIELLGGRMPETVGECLVDGFQADDSILGTKIRLTAANDEDDLENMKTYLYTVVGYVSTPLYMDVNRGTTSVGTGVLEGYVYIPRESINADYYTEIHLTLPGDHIAYSDTYKALTEDAIDVFEPMAEILGQERFVTVKEEAEEEYQDGYQEYLDGVEEYEEGKAEAEQELADAYQELIDGEQEIKDTYVDLQNAERKLYDAKLEIENGLAQVAAGREQLAEAAKKKPELEAAKAELEAATHVSLSAIADSPNTLAAVQQQISQIDAQLGSIDQENAENAELISGLVAKRDALNAQIPGLQQLVALAPTAQQIQGGLAAIAQIPAQEKQLDATEKNLRETLDMVNENITKVYNGYEELKEAEEDIAEGWEEYYDGKAEAEQELADAAQELEDARIDLAEAREEIDDMDVPDVMILDRTSNVGYNNLESASDIVQGVARVLPMFFLLIASLVCITTMTRMIEEERTQIGTLKALGYGNLAIISKYLFYAGSSAVVGCGLGVFLGSTLFPMILWEAYQIMLNIKPQVTLTVNIPLCVAVIGVYLAVILSVTWYCCHKTLKEVPAELIRPKAPDAGKALFVEKMPFWKRMSFLNKVTIRNIFRYRQRMAMMLVGIGGCTALLVTGFGLRDSIVNVVDYQYREVTLYDLEVYFRDDLTEETKAEFLEELDPDIQSMFYHQSSVDISFDGRTKELYMISAGKELENFVRFTSDGKLLSMPGLNEVVLTVGVAENMGIHVGDTVRMRNSDMQILELTVSGIYDNHVSNFSIVLPETIESQWGSLPKQQMAMLMLPEEADSHRIGAELTELSSVMNVSASEDMADMVNNMMETMDLVIVLVVFCAGLLAITVLYNLTNININERIREIATIKVLGFNASETAAYVFKENMALTVVGSVFGLGLGYLLLVFVMTQIRVDMVWFKAMVLPVSYVYSILLTWLSAIAVNFIFYFKLQKINMAEALKSVE